jgi:VanZ family protein
LVILLIVYGSLYPWQYRRPPRRLDALSFLLETRSGRINPRDFLVNIAVYVPLGFAAYLAVRRSSKPLRSLGTPLLLGVGLSTAIELAQAYARARRSNVFDILANGIGTTVGVAAAVAFSASSRRLRSRDAGALAVLFCWIASLWFPFVPLFNLGLVSAKFGSFVQNFAHLGLIPFISSFASWYLAGVLLASAGVRRAKPAAVATLTLLAGQFFVVGRQPSFSHLIGAVGGVLLFFYGPVLRRSWVAASLLAVVILRGLAPFKAGGIPQHFEWTPFVALLDANWLAASQTLIEKVYYYSAAIWSFRTSGMRLLRAAGLVAIALFIVEACQIYLQGRSPEITDPILALLIGFGLDSFKRTSSPSGTSA